MSDLDAFFSEMAASVDLVLDELLPTDGVEPGRLHAAMRWSVFAGGKRFRPALTMAVGRCFGVADERLVKTAAAIEMMHTFSLIHDDLPAMDDDDLRRGQMTCHKKFDEATAILAGDALQTLAFKVIAEDAALPVEVRLNLISRLASATGTPDGMVAGQQLDLEAEGTEPTSTDVEIIHRLKTGALICFAAQAGALIGEANRLETAAITDFAEKLGLLFQITDDLLDVTQTTDALGKTAGKDAAAQKATYPAHFGVDVARQMAAATSAQAIATLEPLGVRAELLRLICDHILTRSN